MTLATTTWPATGQTLFPTPHTDRLAEQGVRLTSAYSPSPVCTPTRYAVLTGTDPFRQYVTSHVLFNGEPLIIGKNEQTVASLLQRAGYATGVVGKWHLGLGDSLPRDLNHPGRGPNEIGFDYSFIVPDGNNMLPHVYHENGAVVGGVEPPFKPNPKVIERIGFRMFEHTQRNDWPKRRPGHEIGATLADRVDAFLQTHADRPFFLYYATCTVHSPFTPDQRFEGKSGHGSFADFVMEFDWAVGRVMDKLDELGLAENTLLIVTSDNGGLPPGATQIAEEVHRTSAPWRGYKGNAYEGGYRVPLLARWPGRIAPGSISDSTVSLVDVMATAAGLAGVKLPEEAALDSFDMLPALLGRETGRPYVMMATRGMTGLSIRENDWKLIYWTGSGPVGTL
jgi:arylsulfatase A